jgi:putative salt-induced outer membrane protein YdiY
MAAFLRRTLELAALGLGLLAAVAAHAQEFASGIGPTLNPQTGSFELRRLPPLEEEDLPGLIEPIDLPGLTDGPSQEGDLIDGLSLPGEGGKLDGPGTRLGGLRERVKLWEGSCELGLDGTEGNSRTFNIRFGMDAKRETELSILKAKLDYRKKTSRSVETAHRAFFDWRAERLLRDSPWSCYVHGTVEYDEFRAFDVRVTADAGLGYDFVRTERTRLVGRSGAGFSREIGGPVDKFVPEAVFGMDFQHRLRAGSRIKAAVEYTPDMTNFGAYRVRSEASWESVLSERMNLSLKLRVQDIYDSTPHGAVANELDYAAMVMWSF